MTADFIRDKRYGRGTSTTGTSALRDTALESSARREAKRVDLVATKSRYRKHTTDHRGGFQLVDPCRHAVVIGSKYNLSLKT
jgi:hypothetical protein